MKSLSKIAFAGGLALALSAIDAFPAFAQTADTTATADTAAEVVFTTDGIGTLRAILTGQSSYNTIVDINGIRSATIANSFSSFVGLNLFNQDVGVANNQANVVLLTLHGSENGAVRLSNMLDWSAVTGNSLTIIGGSRTDTIENSFANSRGVAMINQSSGAVNVQRNVLGLGISLAAGDLIVSVHEGTLSHYRGQNTHDGDGNTPRSDSINNSFSGYTGIAQVTQVAGDGNIVANTVSVGLSVINWR